MPMNKTFLLLASSALLLGITSRGAEARKVTYEIDGKRYSYSTNNIAQTAEARRRIEAARAAEAARARAEAERNSNPLAAALGSPAQKEAAEARNRLQEVLSEASPAVEAPRASERRTGRRGRSADRAKAAVRRVAALAEAPAQPAKPPAATAAPAVAEPLSLHQGGKRVKAISFDVETGIKTIVMVDGTVEEEPFDSSVLAQLAPEQGGANSLTAFVKQLRRTPLASPEEATGSIAGTAVQPKTEASAEAAPRH